MKKPRRINYAKILAVVFLTVLIWVFADRALDATLTIPRATISIVKSIDPSLWVTFDNKPSISIKNIDLKGPQSKIADIKRKINQGWEREFFLDPEQLQMIEAGTYRLDVADFLKNDDQLKEFHLEVESCQPNLLMVNVSEHVKKSLTIKCLDENQIVQKQADSKPPQIDMFVPPDWESSQLVAYVRLNQGELEQAISRAITKTPYIVLPGGLTKEASTTVDISMPLEPDRLTDHIITNVRPVFAFSANLQGKYTVELINEIEVMRPISVSATQEAKAEYENMPYQVTLEIYDRDADANPNMLKTRPLIYNFPKFYVRRNKIELNQAPVEAQFKLVPVAGSSQ